MGVQPIGTAELAAQRCDVLELSRVSTAQGAVDGRLVLVVDDGCQRVCFGTAGSALDAARGALRLAVASVAHAGVLAASVDRDKDVRTMVHLPERPAWLCRRCGGAWPCGTQRRQLVAKFAGEPGVLLALMAARLVDATEDLGVAGLAELHDRFLGWLPAPEVPGTDGEGP